MTGVPPRHRPGLELPGYAYVPGRQPHPLRDPAGHSYGQEHAPLSDPQPQDIPLQELATSPWGQQFLWGVDLFHAGFYWEAHEAWEANWLAAGRKNVWAACAQGLIKLAAAGVKAREGNTTGVARHARRAAELLSQAGADVAVCAWVVNLRDLIAFATDLAENPVSDTDPCSAGKVIFPVVIDIMTNPHIGES